MEPIVFWIRSDGVFGRFDLAALCGCHTFKFVLLCYLDAGQKDSKKIMSFCISGPLDLEGV